MQFTFELGEITGSPEELASVDDLMTRYSSAKRIAFNGLLRKLTMKEVIHGLEATDMIAMNWRYCEHAARDADAELKSQRALLPLYLEDVDDRIEALNQMLTKAKAPKKVERLLTVLAGLEKRRAILKKHLDDGTLPKVIFGTRELFVKRTKGKISNEEWKEARNNQLYSIGQANQMGNANARIDWNEKKIGINFPMKIRPRQAKDRTFHVKNERRWLELKMNGKFEKYTDSLRASGKAYSVRVMRRGSRYFVHANFEISLLSSDNPTKRVCSIDSNPTGFAAAIVGRDGNLLAHRFFRDDRLVCASEKKRDAIIGDIVSKIVAWAREQRAEAFAIEDLKIRGSRSFGRRVNRIVYAFVRRKFSENLLMQCWKDGLSASPVNPAYTSKIGDAKYRAMYGLSVHEAAAFCIGRRFFGFGEKVASLSVTAKTAKVKRKVPVNYVWASIYSYRQAADRRMELPRRKGSARENLKAGNEAVFTGHSVFERTPQTERGEEARKDGEPGGSPGATGNGVKPAPQGGKVAAASSDEMISADMQKTNPLQTSLSRLCRCRDRHSS